MAGVKKINGWALPAPGGGLTQRLGRMEGFICQLEEEYEAKFQYEWEADARVGFLTKLAALLEKISKIGEGQGLVEEVLPLPDLALVQKYLHGL